ncbi:ABC transporter substrate-binding protein [Ruminococcus sp. 5_1_39BFAA]|uniref:ABC transporter substrate-binding protein n=1 Tax=Ruminococcus sp. 5_1_39BFAA TaxID=457412 RepID=UPI003567D5C8
MKKSKLSGLWKKAAVMSVAGILAACMGVTVGAEEAEYKDTLIVAEYGDSDSLDPQKNVSHEKIMRELYEGLLEIDAETGEFVGALAESWEHSDDYMTWTFHLRQGVKFAASGKEMTSADVVATFDRLLDKENAGRYTQNVEFIDTVTALDDYTVEMTLAYEYGAVEDTFTQACTYIMNADYLEEYGSDIGFDPATIDGTGPYKLVSWDMDEEVVLVENEEWWRGEVGTPNLIFKIIPEEASRAMAIETGEVDVMDRPGVDDVQRLEETEGLVVFNKPGYGLHGFQFNCSEGRVCADTKVRQAIVNAIDSETICQALYGSIGETATHAPLAPQYFGYTDMGVQPYDVEKAKELLAEAGYEDGMELSVMTYDGYNKGVELAECIKANLADVGINVTIEAVDGATFTAAVNGITPEEMPWDMFIMGFGGLGGLDCDGCLRRVFVTSPDGLNTNNYGWYSNERVDELLNGAIVEMDQDKRREMYAEAEQIVYLDDPVAVYFNLRSSIFVMTDKVENFSMSATQRVEFEKIKVRE